MRQTFDISERMASAIQVTATEALARIPNPPMCLECHHEMASHRIIVDDPEGSMDVPAVCPCGCTAALETEVTQ